LFDGLGGGCVAFIGADADGRLDFDALITAIGQLYPGTQVTVPDYYAARIAREAEAARARGRPGPNPALECTVRVAEEHGLQRQINVPVREGLSLTGRVDRFGCLFTAERFSRAEVGPLVELLVRAGLSVKVGDSE
jgi:hypothetical protein